MEDIKIKIMKVLDSHFHYTELPSKLQEVANDICHKEEEINITPKLLLEHGFTHRSHLNDYYIPVSDNSILIIQNDQMKICASNQQPCVFMPIKNLNHLKDLYYSLTQQKLKATNRQNY